MNIEEEISREELDETFKALKKNSNAAIMKIFDDGAIKLIDNQGVMMEFATPRDFLRYARKELGGHL